MVSCLTYAQINVLTDSCVLHWGFQFGTLGLLLARWRISLGDKLGRGVRQGGRVVKGKSEQADKAQPGSQDQRSRMLETWCQFGGACLSALQALSLPL